MADQSWNVMEVSPSGGLLIIASYDTPTMMAIRLTLDCRMSHVVEFELKYPILSMCCLTNGAGSGDAAAGTTPLCAVW